MEAVGAALSGTVLGESSIAFAAQSMTCRAPSAPLPWSGHATGGQFARATGGQFAHAQTTGICSTSAVPVRAGQC